MKKLLILLIIPFFFFVACEEDEVSDAEQLKIDISKIEKYLEEHNLTAQSTESGLHYIITEQGTGDFAIDSSFVDVNYTGMLLDSTKFDSDRNTLILYGTIKGWQEGLSLLREGGSIKLFVPSKLGYGSMKSGAIPKNSVLLFDIDLINVIPLQQDLK